MSVAEKKNKKETYLNKGYVIISEVILNFMQLVTCLSLRQSECKQSF